MQLFPTFYSETFMNKKLRQNSKEAKQLLDLPSPSFGVVTINLEDIDQQILGDE